jgi:1-acyl-sn-glycerol-3-phosphate acyltransferase
MLVLGLPLLLGPRAWMHDYARAWARIVLGLLRILCGVRWRVTGAEHLPREGAALIAAQHQSAFDTLVWHAILPRASYVMKIELLRLPVFGIVARRIGSIGVDRAAGASALRDLIRDGRAAAGRGQQIVIFPEGTRTEFGEARTWQPGVAALAGRDGSAAHPRGDGFRAALGAAILPEGAGDDHRRGAAADPAGAAARRAAAAGGGGDRGGPGRAVGPGGPGGGARGRDAPVGAAPRRKPPAATAPGPTPGGCGQPGGESGARGWQSTGGVAAKCLTNRGFSTGRPACGRKIRVAHQ